jgi:hypothetical protein
MLSDRQRRVDPDRRHEILRLEHSCTRNQVRAARMATMKITA